jgi:hypothetical protein
MRSDELFLDQDDEHIVAESGWLEPEDDLEEIHRRYSDRFDELRAALEAELGPALEASDDGPGRFEALNHGLLRYAVFQREGRQYLLGYGQHDQETPVFVATRRLEAGWQA